MPVWYITCEGAVKWLQISSLMTLNIQLEKKNVQQNIIQKFIKFKIKNIKTELTIAMNNMYQAIYLCSVQQKFKSQHFMQNCNKNKLYYYL